MLLGTVTTQFGTPAVGSQHKWTRRATVCGMHEDSNRSFNGGCAEIYGCEPKQSLFADLYLSDCFEIKD